MRRIVDRMMNERNVCSMYSGKESQSCGPCIFFAPPSRTPSILPTRHHTPSPWSPSQSPAPQLHQQLMQRPRQNVKSPFGCRRRTQLTRSLQRNSWFQAAGDGFICQNSSTKYWKTVSALPLILHLPFLRSRVLVPKFFFDFFSNLP